MTASIDLILTSLGGVRLSSVSALCDDLAMVTSPAWRLIVVDQSPDGAVGVVVQQRLRGHVTVIPSVPTTLSDARNRALAVATAPLVAFPDDDARYFPDTLAAVVAAFADPTVDAVCGRLLTPDGASAAGMARAPRMDRTLGLWSLLFTVNSNVLFLRRGSWQFATDLGAGCHLGAGEETDLAIRLFATGHRIVYRAAVCIGHPRVTTELTPPPKHRAYARGYAAMILRATRHTRSLIPLMHFALTVSATVLGVVRNAANTTRRHAYVARLTGLGEGMRAPMPSA